MKPAMFQEMTHVLGAPDNWDAQSKGECLGLPVAVDREQCTFTSCWELEPGELASLMLDGRVYLTVHGAAHPPVALSVRPNPLRPKE